MPYNLSLGIILVTSSAFAILFSIVTRKIQYHGPNTDNELMAHAAAQSYKWRWLSDLHRYSLSPFKMGMKEFTVILISVFQRILRDKKSDHAYVTLSGTMVAVSAILTFLIGSNYWNPTVGLFLGLLLLLSFWPWQIALYGGHPNVAMAISLLSIYFIQQAGVGGPVSQLLWLAAAGGILCLTLFSSASALKYLSLFWGAVIYEKYNLISDSRNGLSGLYSLIKINDYFLLSLFMAALAILSFIAVKLSYKKIVTLMYKNQAPFFLNKIITGREKFELDHYLKHAKRKLKQISLFSAFVLVSFILLVNLLGLSWIALIVAGFAAAFIILNLPDIRESFGHYYAYLKDTQILNKHHFKLYIDFFAKRGITVTREYRGAGLQWLPKIFFRMAPVYTIVFAVGLIFFIFQIIALKNPDMAINGAIILLISLSPILWAEFTRAPQIGRTYSPGFVGTMLFVGYSYSLLANIGSYYFVILFLILGIAAAINGKIFLSDVFPSRMTIANLMEKVDSLKIKRLYTYRTNFNKCFVEGIPGIAVSDFMPNKNIPAPFEMVYIESIADVDDGWIAIPGTSGKAVNMEADKWAILNGDYNLDPLLNKLLETKEIEKIATAKFKTYGTSKWWANESEVTSYRDLILRDIGKEDRWRGYAWLLHTDNLKKYLKK